MAPGLLDCFLHFQNCAAFVLAILWAGTVGQLLLMAVGALGEPAGSQKIMSAAVSRTARGVAPFRIRHCNNSFRLLPAARLAGDDQRTFRLLQTRSKWSSHLEDLDSSGLDLTA